MGNVIKFFKECYVELSKVNWPSRDDVIAQTWVVIGALIAVSIGLGVVDLAALQAIIKILSLGE